MTIKVVYIGASPC